MSREFRTRAGIQPSQQELPFVITTSDCREYLQKKMDIVTNYVRKNNKGGEDIESIDIDLYTTETGRKFLPFVLLLPLEAQSESSTQLQDEIEPIFDVKSEDKSVNLRPEIYNMLKGYIYDKNDGNAFKSSEWRRAREVSRNAANNIRSIRLPRIMKISSSVYIAVLIDPLRVFHDMVTYIPEEKDDAEKNKKNNKNQEEKFLITIKSWKKIRAGEYEYRIVKEKIRGRKNKRKGDRIADDLNAKIRGDRRRTRE